MGRVILLLLLALAVALYFPESRAVLAEHSRPLLDPGLRWMSHQEMNQIVEDLEARRGVGDRLPATVEAFQEWMEARYPMERSRVDPWGQPYGLVVQGDSFWVVSAGPDGEFGTERDLRRGGRSFRR